jgi:predicted amidohydrolase YtcJ
VGIRNATRSRSSVDTSVLAPGTLADITALSQDIFTVAPQAVPATVSVLTLVGGEIVHDALTRPAN